MSFELSSFEWAVSTRLIFLDVGIFPRRQIDDAYPAIIGWSSEHTSVKPKSIPRYIFWFTAQQQTLFLEYQKHYLRLIGNDTPTMLTTASLRIYSLS